MATVSSFSPTAVLGQDGLGNDILGLNKTHTSETTAVITGTDFAGPYPVNVTCGAISWSGTLTVESGSTERGSVALTCNNPPGPGRLAEPESVSVTVGDSVASVFFVQIGTPPPPPPPD